MGISTALYNGLSGLNSYATAIAVASDNVANANTTAFKSNSVRFGDLVNSYYTNLSNDIEREGGGSAVVGFATNYGQGSLTPSDNWSNVAINGDGFFVVNDGTNTYYTRDGSFNLDKDGFLVNAQGYRVQNAGADIQIATPENYSKFRVASDGQIWAVDNTAVPPAEVAIAAAKIDRATFTNKDGLVREGGNLYSAGPEIGNTYLASDTASQPGIKFGDMLDSTIEGSNVDLAKEMVDMIIYQASFNANSKTISTNSGLLDTTVNMVR